VRHRDSAVRDGLSPEREAPTEAWQEWQGSAFARVRSRSLARANTLETSGLSARARTGANIAGICHAEGRGFESHHPLVYPAKRHLWMSLRTTDDLLHALRRVQPFRRTRAVDPVGCQNSVHAPRNQRFAGGTLILAPPGNRPERRDPSRPRRPHLRGGGLFRLERAMTGQPGAAYRARRSGAAVSFRPWATSVGDTISTGRVG
jgi:hypothetical protein